MYWASPTMATIESTGSLVPTCSPNDNAIVGITRSWARTGASSTTIAGMSAFVHEATTALANRVLPTPPGPVTVTSRLAPEPNIDVSRASSTSRPTNDVAGSIDVVTRDLSARPDGSWHRIHQHGAIDVVEVQRVAERSDRARVRAPTISSFERTDGLGGHVGSLCKLLLAQRRPMAEVSKGLPEVTPIVRPHRADASGVRRSRTNSRRDGCPRRSTIWPTLGS